ncbi:unnamed protein product (macronuclear) [Paramecium tetraurelia]|uniref:Uncharacterized protein n=1 Tax=Paramecium tetraurelia TaxID=5888 RepID=A0C6M5_PARTE|nr:uncharacterized protein GSPATT00035571001 [Paramecium tetraurelia]CAK66442.1 unnamed protein product [Paramecium tetraurelia]|eukprot:XP_001433839.1 hypothetical protein (macronuclear) [Paramecium tetraurelia strain d4-2]
MSKTWLEKPKRPLDINFDIKTIRNQVKDKLIPPFQYNNNSGSKQFNSFRKENLPTVPSFDNLQARIRDFSYTRLQSTSSLQSKITSTKKYDEQSPKKTISSMGFRNNIQSYRQQSTIYQPVELNYRTQQKRSLVENIQLNEIVSLRNKIESSYSNRNSLQANYVSELVKLAQAITNALK